MPVARYVTDPAESKIARPESTSIGDEGLLSRLSEADDSRLNRRGRYRYRDNPKTARSTVVSTDLAEKQSSASLNIRNVSVCDLVHLALASTGYPLANVQCTCHGDTLKLSGFVSCYYHAQMAINAARPLARGHTLDYQIEVVSNRGQPIA